jgi:hypothetical protein
MEQTTIDIDKIAGERVEARIEQLFAHLRRIDDSIAREDVLTLFEFDLADRVTEENKRNQLVLE